MEIIQTIEYAFDNRDTVAQHLSPESIKDNEEISVYIYVKNASNEERFLMANYDVKLKIDDDEEKPAEGDESYKEKVKEDISSEDIKFS